MIPLQKTESPMLYRPEPLLQTKSHPVSQRSPLHEAIKQLHSGLQLSVTDHYRTGIQILDALHQNMGPPPPRQDHQAHRLFIAKRRTISSRLLAPIRNHQVRLRGVPPNGFYADLYPQHPDFELPFVTIQELHSAWQDYHQGIHFNVLGHRLHPFYGTYCPSRTEHLELFATWLSQYKGPKQSAVDVGTGTGILAFLLQRSGFDIIHATDTNPNAIESLRRDLERHNKGHNITPACTDLLATQSKPVELIVFNPPWMQGQVNSLIDKGMYYQDDLFERFFNQAFECLETDGRIVLVYSNIQSLLRPDLPHPILTELDKERFQCLNKMQRKIKAKKGHKRSKEKCEIWELGRC